MDQADQDFDFDAVIAETMEYLRVRPGDAPNQWVGEPAPWFGDYLFGGAVLGQALIAATRDVPEGRRLHSMHAYFLRPVSSSGSIAYSLTAIREGRSFLTRRLEAQQHGKPVLDMTCSLTADTDGYVYDLPDRRDIAPPNEDAVVPGLGPWVAEILGPTPAAADGTRESTHRMWFRIPCTLPDDVHLHTALLGFATDWTEIGARPLHLDGDTQGIVSLDHAAWFHRPARADEWLFYDLHSLVNAGGRGYIRGVMRDLEGRVVLSVAQEQRLTPI